MIEELSRNWDSSFAVKKGPALGKSSAAARTLVKIDCGSGGEI